MSTASHTRSDLGLLGPEIPLDVVRAKLQVPAPRPGNIPRTALVNRLRAARASRVVIVTAPAGYGKTTVLAQWAARDNRPFAWVSIDERDADPVVLLRHVAGALHAIEPLDESILDAVRESEGSVWAASVPRLTAVLESRSPCVVVLDDVTLLKSKVSEDVVAALIAGLSQGSTLVLAGRTEPRLLLAGLRTSGELFEVGTELLALTKREGEQLIRAADVQLSDDQVSDLLERTEGWPAGLYLGALALGANDGSSFGGDDRYLADYFRSVCHEVIDPARLAFLRRISVLDELSGALCDAVLGREGSGVELCTLEAENLFVVPLDRRATWFRCHPLFRDLLIRELEHEAPGFLAELRLRAADWFEANGEPERAIDYAAAAGDLSRVARLVSSLAPRAPATAAARWLEYFDENALARHPEIAAIGAWAHASLGYAARAERCLAISERDDQDQVEGGQTPVRPLTSIVRAILCRHGVARMLVDIEEARAELSPTSPWLPAAVFLHGVGHLLNGDDERADAELADAAERAEALSIAEIRVAALSQRALIAGARSDQSTADGLALQARALASREGGRATAALEGAAAARALLRRSRFDEARVELAAVGELEPLLTHAIPWLTVETRLELARAYLALRDVPASLALLAEAARILRLRPELGILGAQIAELGLAIEAIRKSERGKQLSLTRAELRLLPFLATHLSFREIGSRLYVSHHTIKTQAISVYRKLGVSSRSQAIEAAARLGLVEIGAGELTPGSS